MNSRASRFLAGPYILWMIGFTVIPLIMIIVYGLTDSEGRFTLANVAAISSPEHLKALLLALGLSLASTVICLVMAYPLALILRKKNVGKGSFIVFIFILPMWMNFLLRTMAWQTLLEKNGVINGILSFLHLPNIAVINTPWAIILGMVYNFLPFMVLPIYNVLAKIDDDVINAAKDLGGEQLADHHPHPDSPKPPRHHQRNQHGVRACPHHLRDLQPPGGQQDPAHRKCHRAGVHPGQQLASGIRPVPGADGLHPGEHGPHGQI